jgi:hypothetical protein
MAFGYLSCFEMYCIADLAKAMSRESHIRRPVDEAMMVLRRPSTHLYHLPSAEINIQKTQPYLSKVAFYAMRRVKSSLSAIVHLCLSCRQSGI